MWPSIFVTLLVIAAVALTAKMGAVLTNDTIKSLWYKVWLSHPKFQPPAIWFGIVWPILYVCMTLAQLLVEGSILAREELVWLRVLFVVSLALNYYWNVAFAEHKLWRAALVCFLLTMTVYAEMFYITAFGANPLAWWLLLPYLGWSAFATMLSIETARLNE